MNKSSKLYESVKRLILTGIHAPNSQLSPQQIAKDNHVSLSVAREVLVRLIGDGLIESRVNIGFFLPDSNTDRWAKIAEARVVIEQEMLKMAIDDGDVQWESDIEQAFYTLEHTPMIDNDNQIRHEWNDAHYSFHKSLLKGCNNSFLINVFDKLWDASSLARAWSIQKTPGRNVRDEHADLKKYVIERNVASATEQLRLHILETLKHLDS